MLFLDIIKAYEKLDRTRSLMKLINESLKYGINEKEQQWFHSYLENRIQKKLRLGKLKLFADVACVYISGNWQL